MPFGRPAKCRSMNSTSSCATTWRRSACRSATTKLRSSMRIDRLKIRGFKNLDDVDIDFDQDSLETVLIGQNGSGKSNVIEALATIFRDLDYPRRDSEFDYYIAYDCKDHRIEIDRGYSEPGDTL